MKGPGGHNHINDIHTRVLQLNGIHVLFVILNVRKYDSDVWRCCWKNVYM